MRFCFTRGCGVERVIHPIFDPRQCCKGPRKVWIEPGRSLEQLLSLFDVGTESIWSRKQTVPLHKSQVRFAVLSRLAFNLRLFGGRQFSTEFAGDFLSEITLNGEYVCSPT